LLDPDEYILKLKRVLDCRGDMLVVARTDAVDENEALQRAVAYAQAGADAVLVEAVKSLSALAEIKKRTGVPLMFNQIAGGKSLVNYSTPCLFAAQKALEESMRDLQASGGLLPYGAPGQVGVVDCNRLLHQNLERLKVPVL
jgi:2-methylisocitrate lyase-like PEP mutase family enzyme